ncbi:dihydrofolate reductase family protein [Actinoplanes sp. NPDC051861]|uniref:RibD family protein n=1 Tax=Actinoplanes sp. NPDC051861 TaxID=3155170 RepID=UPI0034253549
MGIDQRPRVILSVTATADGRVALDRESRLLDPAAGERWRSLWPPDVEDLLARRTALIEELHSPTVILEGSGTFVPDDRGPLDLPPTGDDLTEDFLPFDSAKWFAVVDSRGRVEWSYKRDGDTHLLLLVSSATPRPYLAYLRRENIPYLITGTDHVDLPAALSKMHLHLNVTCVHSQAGGTLNSALLRAGLVDELHVITVPALVGGLTTPSIMDGPPLPPRHLRTVDVTLGSHGSIWTRYEIA